MVCAYICEQRLKCTRVSFLSDLLRSIIIQRACCSELPVSLLPQQLAALVLWETICDIANSLLLTLGPASSSSTKGFGFILICRRKVTVL